MGKSKSGGFGFGLDLNIFNTSDLDLDLDLSFLKEVDFAGANLIFKSGFVDLD